MRLSVGAALALALLCASPSGGEGDVSVVWSGPARPAVALTFDDGPKPGVTDRILDRLEEVGARATFFVVGERVASSGEPGRRLLGRMIAEGHEIGNHSWSHASFTRLDRGRLLDEIARTQNLVEQVAGVRPRLLRPPGGALDVQRIRSIAGSDIRAIVMWSVDPSDWRGHSREALWTHIGERLQPGAIILLHDVHSETLAALPLLLDMIQARGFEIVTVSELLSE